jgi:thymidylate synthase
MNTLNKIYNPEWSARKRRNRNELEALRMLVELMKADTPKEKRKVIKTYNPYHYIFGNKLNPRKEVSHEQESV